MIKQLSIAALLLIAFSSVYAEDVLVEEHFLGNVTRYYETDEPIPFERTQDCIAPPQIGRQVDAVQGFSFRIIVPDNNHCWLTNVVLSSENYTAMQNNIGIFTVKDKTAVVASPTHNYCQLAYWIWNGETEDYKEILKKYPTRYVFPDYCYEEIPNAIIPEFGVLALITLSAAVTGVALVRRK